MGRRPFFRPPEDPLITELERAGPPPWEARVQDFVAGGIGIRGAVMLWPEGERRVPAPDESWPLVVLVLDERAYRVAPGFSALFAAGDLLTGATPEHPPVWAQWAALDGPDPLVKVRVHATEPVRLDADLVLPARPLADVLEIAAHGPGIGLIPDDGARRLPHYSTLNEALRDVVLVPTLSSADVTELLERHGWSGPPRPGPA